MSGTAVHQALTALVDLWTPVVPDGWQVFDGRPRDPRRRFVAIGWAGDSEPAVTAQRNTSDYGPSQMAEDLQVSCVASAWAGDKPLPPVRDGLFDVFDILEAALLASYDLDGACLAARIQGFAYTPVSAAEGVLVQAQFVVAIDALQ